MKVINIIKYTLACFAYFPHSSSAIGPATGPSLGISGFHTHFDSKHPLEKKVTIGNLALQMGWFVKLDLGLLYAKLDGLFVLDWHRLPHTLQRDHFQYLTLPLTVGMPVLSIFRPHIGLVFRVPLYGLDHTSHQGNELIERYKEKINGYILGLGIDISNLIIDIHWEFAQSSLTRNAISDTLVDGHKEHRPQQLTLKIGYNLLGW
ncbi:MAG: hypothetical protein NMK33_05045 [Candidatus Cardinium sp.]|uniref:hypothetical protein n=1 Tax=Cardinium endosymbiont of Dermatophagoides farinae TaxID=2597823 RepID=UPI0011828466|nr:hypothetical protein [Cardinium endosymbiont of Dermatophagoides farinae]TSJ80785.1 hypothetical protein FPG78_01830 [Cardinium endosymbiont of Dermatophagoides farinae]UWW96788.1 MAG: hypothetical protein NMK33_05045 [Candidatus Cardinium sp.]